MSGRRYQPSLSNLVLTAALVACSGPLAGGTLAQAGRTNEDRPAGGGSRSDAVVVESDVMIPMRDGVKLATDIYRSGSGGVTVMERLPILLQRTPSNKGAATAQARYFAQIAENIIYHDAAHPSAIVLPLVPHATPTASSFQPKPAPEDKFLTVDGLRLHYLDWGGAGNPPLLMFHGIARHAHTFDHIAADLSRDYHVMAVDLRGHGDSAWSPEGAYLVEDYVKDLEGMVGQLGLKNLTLLGNSTGGRVAQVFAGMHPDLVSAVVIEDVGPERPQDIASGFTRRVQEEANGWASEDELVAQLVKQNARTPERLLRTYAHYGLTPRADGRMVWKRDPNLVKGFVVTELWQQVSRITAPIIYILGGASTIVPADTQARLKQTLPRVEIVTMPGLGHYPDSEDTAGFMTILNRFLKRS